jgi:molecular chaperone DnaK (HSP70)
VPSQIQYNGRDAVAWGFGLDETETTFEWFKLILDYENLPQEIQSSKRVQKVYQRLRAWREKYWHDDDVPKAAVKVTTDYLRKLWRHGINAIQKKQGQTWMKGVPCRVVITKPAIWSQKASSRTQEAAEQAILEDHGPFDSISVTMIAEPEAAAQAILQDPDVTERPDLTKVCQLPANFRSIIFIVTTQPGDIYLICDAGGGTVVSNALLFINMAEIL